MVILGGLVYWEEDVPEEDVLWRLPHGMVNWWRARSTPSAPAIAHRNKKDDVIPTLSGWTPTSNSSHCKRPSTLKGWLISATRHHRSRPNISHQLADSQNTHRNGYPMAYILPVCHHLWLLHLLTTHTLKITDGWRKCFQQTLTLEVSQYLVNVGA